MRSHSSAPKTVSRSMPTLWRMSRAQFPMRFCAASARACGGCTSKEPRPSGSGLTQIPIVHQLDAVAGDGRADLGSDERLQLAFAAVLQSRRGGPQCSAATAWVAHELCGAFRNHPHQLNQFGGAEPAGDLEPGEMIGGA